MTRFKGPLFKSFTEPPPQSRGSRKGADTYAPHDNKRACIRRLRQQCSSIISSQDPFIKEILGRLREALDHDESKFLYVINKAREVTDSTGAPFDTALEFLLDKVKESKTETTV